MPARPCSSLAGLLFAVCLCAAGDDDVAAVKDRLDKAKQEYNEEVARFKKSVTDLIDQREEAARRDGNKKLVDRIKAEREAFAKTGTLPPVLPAGSRQRMSAARGKLDPAYSAAVRDHVRLKRDAEAAELEFEQERFRAASAVLIGRGAYLTGLKHSEIRVANDWFSAEGVLAAPGGGPIRVGREPVPHSIFLHPPANGSSQVRYALTGRWATLRATVGVPTVGELTPSPATQLTFEVLGDDKSLWKSKPVGKADTFQTCEAKIDKVKVLTLRVHCPGSNDSAWAVWFEPVLMEP